MHSFFNSRLGLNYLKNAMLVIFSFGLSSPFAHNLGVGGVFAVVMLTTYCIIVIIASERVRMPSTPEILLISFYFFSLLVGLMLKPDIRFLPALLFSYAFILLSIIDIRRNDLLLIVRVASVAMFWVLFFGAIAFVLKKIDLPYLFALRNPDGRLAYLYFLTLTNAPGDGDYLRIAGIYDEPGALAYYITIIVILRSLLGFDSRRTLYLLLLGFMTQSIVMYLVFSVWIVWAMSNKVFKNNVIIYIFLLFFFLLAYWFEVFNWAIGRLFFYIDNPDATQRIPAFLYILDSAVSIEHFFLGPELACGNPNTDCGFLIGQNILTPFAYAGVLLSWPFYAFIIFTFFSFFIRKYKSSSLLLLLYVILLVQRPYALEIPYLFSFFLVLRAVAEIEIDKR